MPRVPWALLTAGGWVSVARRGPFLTPKGLNNKAQGSNLGQDKRKRSRTLKGFHTTLVLCNPFRVGKMADTYPGFRTPGYDA